jgi:hypothetical protein
VATRLIQTCVLVGELPKLEKNRICPLRVRLRKGLTLRTVVIIREIGIISGLVTVGITDVVSPSGLPRYHRDTQVIPNFLDFKNWYHRWAGITTPYHVFYIEYDNYYITTVVRNTTSTRSIILTRECMSEFALSGMYLEKAQELLTVQKMI